MKKNCPTLHKPYQSYQPPEHNHIPPNTPIMDTSKQQQDKQNATSTLGAMGKNEDANIKRTLNFDLGDTDESSTTENPHKQQDVKTTPLQPPTFTSTPATNIAKHETAEQTKYMEIYPMSKKLHDYIKRLMLNYQENTI